ncbi:hypothetical protein [Psychrobacter sp.]|uniref:hypothetical protein n=1 Tax=Psychrobacter sp. TaxID=56811 RepID=UPI003C7826E7
MSNDNPQTFLAAQLAYAKSKQGKEQKRRDKEMQRYHQIKRAADKMQRSYDDESMEGDQ